MSRSTKTLALALLAAALLAAPAAQATPAADEARIAAARGQPRDQVALATALRGAGPLPRAARSAPLDVRVGAVEQFWVADPADGGARQVSAELRYAGPHVLMYVDERIAADQADVERSARQFEDQIYPRDRELFGPEPAPGVDGDPRLTVLNTTLRGAGGYFSTTDAVVRAVNRFSNERDMFVIDVGAFPLGSDGYAATLAHEFQHMIHSGRQPGAAAWFDEGMATIAEDKNGFADDSMAGLYLQQPDLPLMDWDSTLAHYGMARLFLRYVDEQYGRPGALADLVAQDAGNDLSAFARLAAERRPDVRAFPDLFADWAVATLLADPAVGDGRYAFRGRPTPPATEAAAASGQGRVHQFGVDYLELPKGPLTLQLRGATTVPLLGAGPAAGRWAWWSGRGDQRVATLTRELDLRRVRRATLRFKAWYELERGYDYAFVSVSQDGGATWSTLRATTSTTEDPQGDNYGQGLTGVSGAPAAELGAARGRWVDEQADLTPYAGRRVLLRFWAINDAALNGGGLLLDSLRVPELGLSDGAEAGEAGWAAQGFVRVGGVLPQRWALRLVRIGAATTVEPVAVGADGRAQVRLAAGERGVLVVAGATRFTSEQASYSYVIRR